MKQSFLIFILSLSLTVPCFSAFGETLQGDNATNPVTIETMKAPELNAEAAILMDATTGEILFEKNSKSKMYPASITKIMTVLLALEKGNLSDTITFSHDAVYSIEPGSAHIAMQEDEQITLEQALYGILLRSANEVANAVGEYVDGSIPAFAQHMTQRAKELGCESTNFLNANGLFDENHYTTAYDMACIARELLKQEAYQKMMSNTYYEIPPTNKQTETRYLHGQHQMLNPNSIYYYEYATGGKTGYTWEALNTLVTFAKKGDTQLIAVVLKCKGAEHYVDSKALFEYGFANFQTVKVFSAQDYIKTVKVVETYKSKTTTLGNIQAVPKEDVYKTIPTNTTLSDLKIDVNCPETIDAPISVGQEIGTITAKSGATSIATSFVAQSAVAATSEEAHLAQEKESKVKLLKTIGTILLGILLSCLIVFAVTRTIGHLKRKKRRKLRSLRRKKYRR
ncbi:D-alanyl-D-alanine carboxypeptidase family protein [Anaerotignum sp.]|uniref:D-alanyl-D-alanine carboxypeptidase family protein n=1 Tax=Anaerotignum sp. TaxID=2039241 RepID=UPI002899FD6E|nr:D-alanyl-D-alanine carboxypeptidase family protein [Anaerotignum sp.]